MIVLLTAVAFEVSRRARLERLSALNSIDDVVVTAALDASVEQAREWLNDRLTHGGVADHFVDEHEVQSDSWANLTAFPSDTVRLTNAQFVTEVSDVEARLNINKADTFEIVRFLSALGFNAVEAEGITNAIFFRRDGRFMNASFASRESQSPAQQSLSGPARNELRSVNDLSDVVELTPEFWRRAAPLLTGFGSGRINLRTASGPVLATLPAFSDEVVDAVGDIRDAGGRLTRLEDLLPRLSFSARQALLTARPELEQRISFETTEVEIRSRAWTAGGLYAESVALIRRNDRQLNALVVRLQ
jgi:hypothetical protein